MTGSNLTNFKGCVKAGRDQWGNHLSYGVREFGMAAIMNGIALHGGYIPYGGTFLTFSDYSRNAIRMAALMKLRVIHVFTHDSIGLGEDGPTHQSVEHIPSLRIIPGLDVWRPADGLETAVAWASAIERKDGPSALCLSRQNLPRLTDAGMVDAIRRGGYVLSDMTGAQAVIVSTGSELELAMQAQATLAAEGIATRVVSMPCTNVFDRQTEAYQESVLPLALPPWRSRPRTRTSGANTWAAPAWWWASPALASRLRPKTCTPTSASLPSVWWRPCARWRTAPRTKREGAPDQIVRLHQLMVMPTMKAHNL